MASWVNASSRQGALGIRRTRAIAYALPSNSARFFSVALQNSRPSLSRTTLLPLCYSRSIWGSVASKSSSISSTLPDSERPIAQTLATPAQAEDLSAPSRTPETVWSDTVDPLIPSPDSHITSTSDAILSLDVSSIQDAVTTASSFIPPSQYGDLASLGLISWTPAGLIRYSLELIQVGTGMPWFWTIIAGAAFWRIAVFPLSAKILRNTGKLQEHQPQIDAAKARLDAAKITKNPDDVRAAMLEIQKVHREAGVNPITMLIPPFVQIPLAMGTFFGVKKMCELPVEQLKNSGFEYLPDLTAITSVADPYYVMPVLMVVMMNYQMKLAARDMDPSKAQGLHIMNTLRFASPLFAAFLTTFPVGLSVSILSGVAFTGVTSYLLQTPAIRRLYGIRPLPQHPPKLPSFTESRAAIYQYLEDAQRLAISDAEAKVKEEQRRPRG